MKRDMKTLRLVVNIECHVTNRRPTKELSEGGGLVDVPRTL